MSRVIDNLIAYRVLSMLVKPIVDTDAYKLGIVDNKGRNLIKPSQFENDEQKNAYTYLHRLVFNMKKIINKLPGGENKLKSLVASYFLIKEYYEKNDRSIAMMEDKFNKIMESDVVLIEETILVEKIKKELDEDGAGGVGGGGAPANSTAGVAGTTIDSGGPVIKKKDVQKYKKGNVATGPVAGLARRATPMQ